MLEAEVDDSPLTIEERDIRDVGLEDGGDLLADEVDEGVDVELAGQLLRDGVHGVERRGALLRFGEEPGVFHRDCCLQREIHQELEVAIVERHASGTPHTDDPAHHLSGE